MRTKEETISLASNILKCPVHFLDTGKRGFLIWWERDQKTHKRFTDLLYAQFDEEFLGFTEIVQDFILKHEMGHVVSYRENKPAHIRADKLEATGEIYLLDPDTERQIQLSRELEADLYAAQQMGIRTSIEIMSVCLRGDQRDIRIKNLLDAWGR